MKTWECWHNKINKNSIPFLEKVFFFNIFSVELWIPLGAQVYCLRGLSYTISGYLHSNVTILKHFPVELWTPLKDSVHWSGRGVLFTLSEDTCIVMSGVVALHFVWRIFYTVFLWIWTLTLNSSLDLMINTVVTILNI